MDNAIRCLNRCTVGAVMAMYVGSLSAYVCGTNLLFFLNFSYSFLNLSIYLLSKIPLVPLTSDSWMGRKFLHLSA